MRKRLIFIAPMAILALLLFIALGGVIVRELWNWLLPALFGWRPITFWQAVGLLGLCRILFGGLGLRGGSGSHYRRRWEAMTPEERERIRERLRTPLRDRCGFGPSTGEGQRP